MLAPAGVEAIWTRTVGPAGGASLSPASPATTPSAAPSALPSAALLPFGATGAAAGEPVAAAGVAAAGFASSWKGDFTAADAGAAGVVDDVAVAGAALGAAAVAAGAGAGVPSGPRTASSAGIAAGAVTTVSPPANRAAVPTRNASPEMPIAV